mmetsp:Transcript_32257/g.32549  ORF Transcript_32257/g.32549 Transcript_32257/m.32549 type:complete len:85 (+) Transcript_32257:496-750(+)
MDKVREVRLWGKAMKKVQINLQKLIGFEYDGPSHFVCLPRPKNGSHTRIHAQKLPHSLRTQKTKMAGFVSHPSFYKAWGRLCTL